ncbi:MAG: hypothetical protein NT147_03385 [Candidatus Aminicenantes bacterium]|nr:hypothetical protein [Candidatus Aminicenantes bacterium]
MSKRLHILALLLFAQVAFQNLLLGQPGEKDLLSYDYNGTGKPGASGPDFLKVMSHLETQKVLLDIAAEPKDPSSIEKELKGTGVTVGVLEALRLIRRDGDRYVLAFSLLANADLDRIRAVAEKEGNSLAAAFLARRSEIENILARNPQPGVDGKARAFIILGCASLDWDGLNLIRKRGYLAVPRKEEYLPEAREIGGGGSLRGIYWGSHSYHEAIAVTSFGDHYSLPRNALPDILSSLASSLSQMDAPESLKNRLVGAADALIRRRAGMIMLALRESEKTLGQLALASNITEVETKKILDLLLELNYVSVVDNHYQAIIPVLDESDSPMVKELRRLGQDVMVKWFDDHYTDLSQQLNNLTPVRYGMPLSESFYSVWHYVFGIANRELVAAGLFANPYDNKRVFKGFVPTVYILSVLQGTI